MNFKSARQALVLALSYGYQRGGDGLDSIKLGTRVQYTSINRSLSSIANGLECGQVWNALEKSGKAAQHWGHYCYGVQPDLHWGAVNTYIAEAYATKLASQKSSKHAIRLMQLIPMIMDDYRVLISSNGRSGKYSTQQIQDALGLTEGQKKSWARDYHDHIQSVKSIIDKLDRDSLAPVAEFINEQSQRLAAEAEL